MKRRGIDEQALYFAAFCRIRYYYTYMVQRYRDVGSLKSFPMSHRDVTHDARRPSFVGLLKPCEIG